MQDADIRGSCLCGEVRYRIEGEVKRFYHCHCSRCRKASGTGHASNLMVTADTIHWLSGEQLVGRFKVPEAERYASQFCKNCGSPLPRAVPELGAVVIPAGSLDSNAPIDPQARIFWDSRASWSCGDDGLPTFGQYPPTPDK